MGGIQRKINVTPKITTLISKYNNTLFSTSKLIIE